jgi:spermidine synthase
MKTKYLYFAVFSSGMTTLGIEFAASRLLGNIYGSSNVVWASIIGLILIYLTVGYTIGGRWADHSPYPTTMYTIMSWGAFLSGIVPLIANPVLRAAADAFDQLELGLLFGAFTGVLVLLSAPITLMGAISPFAIRLAIQDTKRAGEVSGRIYAISTLGSFIGTFLPTLILIPLVGVTRTFLLFAYYLLFVAILGVALQDGWRKALKLAWMPLALVFLVLVNRDGRIKSTMGQIYEIESAYNYIQVLEQDSRRLLRLNEGQGVHSEFQPDTLDYDGPWEQFLIAPFFNLPSHELGQVQSLAIVGLAAGTTARQASVVFGPIPIDGFEIDPMIIEVGKRYFGMTMPNLNAVAQDGRWGLEHSQRLYSIIAIDAYRPPYIPPHLTTQEFFQIVRSKLTDDGVVSVNVGRSPDDRRLIEGIVGTLSTLFPSVYVMDLPESFNSIIYATRKPTNVDYFYQNLIHLMANPEIHPLLLDAMRIFVVYQQPTPDSQVVYTDDISPVEWVTNTMVLNYLFFGDMEVLK